MSVLGFHRTASENCWSTVCPRWQGVQENEIHWGVLKQSLQGSEGRNGAAGGHGGRGGGELRMAEVSCSFPDASVERRQQLEKDEEFHKGVQTPGIQEMEEGEGGAQVGRTGPAET